MTITDDIINKTIEYLAVPSVVDNEAPFMTYLCNDFKALGLNVEVSDNLISINGAEPHSHIISAHIDRHGLISLGDGEYFYAAQYVKEVKYGESNIGAEEILRNAADRFLGEHVYAYDSENGESLAYGTISSQSPSVTEGDGVFFIHNMRDMPFGTPIAYAQQPYVTKTEFSGQIDNVLSVATIYALYQNGYRGTALLTTEEELGKSWLHMARYLKDHNIETDDLYVLDTSPYADEHKNIIHEGTVILRRRDKSEVFNAALTQSVADICRTFKLPHQVKDEFLTSQGKTTEQLGSTELGKLIKFTENRWNGTTIQIPSTAYHTSHETTSRKAIKNYYLILEKLLID